jgi:hypothetical protein
VVRERVFDNAVFTNADGTIVWNAAQMDAPVIFRDYDDGTRHVINQRTGKLIVAPYNPLDEREKVRCPHCNHVLGT